MNSKIDGMDSKKEVRGDPREMEASEEELKAVCYTGILLICLALVVLVAVVGAAWQGVEEWLALN